MLKEVIYMPKQETGMGGRSQFNIAQQLGGSVVFPCDRETLLEQARLASAGNDALNIIRNMPDQQYTSMTEVEKAYNLARQKAA